MGVVGLVGPIYTDFLEKMSFFIINVIEITTHGLVNATAVEGLHRSFSRAGVVVLDKAVVHAFALELLLTVLVEDELEKDGERTIKESF